MSELMTVKELAAAMKRSPWYVYAMRRAGFPMPGGTATVQEARDWLAARPGFSAKSALSRDRECDKDLVREL